MKDPGSIELKPDIFEEKFKGKDGSIIDYETYYYSDNRAEYRQLPNPFGIKGARYVHDFPRSWNDLGDWTHIGINRAEESIWFGVNGERNDRKFMELGWGYISWPQIATAASFISPDNVLVIANHWATSGYYPKKGSYVVDERRRFDSRSQRIERVAREWYFLISKGEIIRPRYGASRSDLYFKTRTDEDITKKFALRDIDFKQKEQVFAAITGL
jgi:hypothetical protein